MSSLKLKNDNMLIHEKTYLSSLVEVYSKGNDQEKINAVIRSLAARTFFPFISDKQAIALELGCSDGFMANLIADKIQAVHVLEGAQELIVQAEKEAKPNVKFIHTLFEEFNSEQKYDYIFALFVLEHVFDVQMVLDMVKRVLKPGGIFFVTVPNARALSRQISRHMGIIEDLKQLTANDIRFGHRRVYDRCTLNEELTQAGFSQIMQGGLLLKILADFQLNELFTNGFLSDQHIDALYKLGLEYPDLCGSLFSVCKLTVD
ncbi:S-adenosylmethionine-dependent methyltransferase [Rickettsiales bacterium Ac37b]|nr:S-adenosylmethionine-dependent methyltransferase [Rickettsiales bacterium Ac37b]